MRKKSAIALILLVLQIFHGCVAEDKVGYLANSGHSKIDLQRKAGEAVHIPCDVLSCQEEWRWIEWRKIDSGISVLMKFPNYHVYIHPDLSTRFNMDENGGLLINSLIHEDSATYECRSFVTTKQTLVHGSRVNLNIEDTEKGLDSKIKHVVIGHSAVLACELRNISDTSKLLQYSWTKNGVDVTFDQRCTMLKWGGLFVRRVAMEDAGSYVCTAKTLSDTGGPKIYRGVKVILQIWRPPVITHIKANLTVLNGGDVYMPCSSLGYPTKITTSWKLNNKPLPNTFNSRVFPDGTLYLQNVNADYEGVYECTPFNKIGAGNSAETILKVIATPLPPIIKNVVVLSKSAVVSWERGYNGGSRQTLEIWYQPSDSDDKHWKRVRHIPADFTWFTVYEIKPLQSYVFSMRGVNRIGFGVFSSLFQTNKFINQAQPSDVKAFDKPLAPSNVICDGTPTGLKISWSYYQTPGRPQLQYFMIEYQEVNSSLSWKTLTDVISSEKRHWFIGSDILNPRLLYEFRMFSFAGAFSNPSNVAATTPMTESPTFLPSSSGNDDVLIAVCFVSIIAVVVIFAGYCCCRVRVSRKNSSRKERPVNRIYKLNKSCSSRGSTQTDSEFDSCDLHDVKFIPNVSAFVLESQENVHRSRLEKTSNLKCKHKSAPFDEEHATCAVVGTLADRSNMKYLKENVENDHFLQNYETCVSSRGGVSTAFNSTCLLPDFPELRDSYDQFCTMSEHSSHDDLDTKLSNKSVLSELKSVRGMRDSMCSSEESVHACKRRRKTSLEQGSDGKNHRWSMPEFTKPWQENSCEGDLDYYLNGLDPSQEGGQLYSEQSSQTFNTPALSNPNPIESSLDSTPPGSMISGYRKTQESRSKEKIILGESKSFPCVPSSNKPLTSFDTQDYDSSGCHVDSGDDSLTSSPIHSSSSVDTVRENSRWHEQRVDLKDSGIYVDENADVSASPTKMNQSNSSHSAMGEQERDSPHRKETNFGEMKESHADVLNKSKLHSGEKYIASCVDGVKDEDSKSEGQLYGMDIPHSWDVGSIKIDHNQKLDKEVLNGEKERRCARLMQEYIVNKTLNYRTSTSSSYQASAV